MQEERPLRFLIDRHFATSLSATSAQDALTSPRAVSAFTAVAASSWHIARALEREVDDGKQPVVGGWARVFDVALSAAAQVSDALALSLLDRHLARHTQRLRAIVDATSGRDRELLVQVVFPAHVESHAAVRDALDHHRRGPMNVPRRA